LPFALDISGNWSPVTVAQPSIDDEDEQPASEVDYQMPSSDKGKKRRADFDDDDN